MFDAALVDDGFGLSGTSADETEAGDDAKDSRNKWDGISEVILGKKEWFDTWMEGEKRCEFVAGFIACGPILYMHAVAEDQYNEIISAPDAWLVADEAGEDVSSDHELRPTNSARRIKALVEQVTGEFEPFLHLQHILTTA